MKANDPGERADKGFKKQSVTEVNHGRQENLEDSDGRSAFVWFLCCRPLSRDPGLFRVSGPLLSGIHYLPRMLHYMLGEMETMVPCCWLWGGGTWGRQHFPENKKQN